MNSISVQMLSRKFPTYTLAPYVSGTANLIIIFLSHNLVLSITISNNKDIIDGSSISTSLGVGVNIPPVIK